MSKEPEGPRWKHHSNGTFLCRVGEFDAYYGDAGLEYFSWRYDDGPRVFENHVETVERHAESYWQAVKLGLVKDVAFTARYCGYDIVCHQRNKAWDALREIARDDGTPAARIAEEALKGLNFSGVDANYEPIEDGAE